MKRMLASDGINYWTRQPFLNRMRGAGGASAANQPSATDVAYWLVPMMGDQGRTMVLTWEGPDVLDITVTVKRHVAPNRIEFDFAGENNAMPLVLPNGSKPTRVRIVPLDQEHLTQTFRPEYEDDVRGFYRWRAMDFFGTNDNATDNLRMTHDPEAYGDWGSLAEAVELINRTGTSLWVNLPHRISEANARAVIAYLEANCILPPVVEFSNEIVWNWQFQQTAYAHEQRPNDPNGWVGEQVAKLQRYAAATRVKCVMASQFVNPWHFDMQMGGFVAAGGDPTQLAGASCTTYVGFDLPDYAIHPDLAWQFAEKNDIVGALAYVMTGLAQFRGYLDGYADRAKRYGIPLLPYEGGMWHLNASGSSHDRAVLTAFYKAVQMKEGAAAVLLAYDREAEAAGVEVQALYNYASPSTEYGFFGASLQPIWAIIKAEQRGTAIPDAEPAPTPPAPPPPPVLTPAPAKVTKAQVLTSLTAIDKSVTAARALVNGKKVDPAIVQQALGRTLSAAEAARVAAGGYAK